MSSPVATVGLYYDVEDLQTADLSIFLEIVTGLDEPPKVRGTDSIVPALAGRIEGLRINDVLPIELAGHVRHDPSLTDLDDMKASFRANQLFVRTLFSPTRSRANLLAVLEDGSTVYIPARPLNAIWKAVVPGLWHDVSIQLEGYDDWADASLIS